MLVFMRLDNKLLTCVAELNGIRNLGNISTCCKSSNQINQEHRKITKVKERDLFSLLKSFLEIGFPKT